MRRRSELMALGGLVLALGLGCGFADEILGSDSGSTTRPETGPTVPADVPETMISAEGEACEGMFCEDHAVCIGYAQGSICSWACEVSEPYCPDGSLCLELYDQPYGVCATYGQTGEGGACDTSLDCQRSLACISDRGAPAVCTYTCDLRDEEVVECPDGWHCSISTGGVSFGVCKPAY